MKTKIYISDISEFIRFHAAKKFLDKRIRVREYDSINDYYK